jgi:glycosyltransferase involved in cell wall biosynthesis
MRILIHISKVRPYGSGYQIMLGNLASGFVLAGHSISVEGDFQDNPTFAQTLRDSQVEVIQYGFSRKPILECLSFLRQMRLRHFDLVISSGLSCDARLGLLRPFVRSRLAAVFQENPHTAYTVRGWYGRILASAHGLLTALTCQHIVCTSDYVQRAILRFTPINRNRFLRIHNGIDMPAFMSRRVKKKDRLWGTEGSSFKYFVGIVGRISPEKNPQLIFTLADLLEAQSDLAGKIAYVIIGDGTMRPEMEQQAKLLERSERFLFPGSLENMAKAYEGLDVLVHFCRSEGFGLVPLESIASGVTAVCLRGGALDQIIGSVDNGFLVDNLEEMARVVRQRLCLAKCGNSTAEAGRQAVTKDYGLERQVAEYERLLGIEDQ